MGVNVLFLCLISLAGFKSFGKQAASVCEFEGSYLVFPKGKELRVLKYEVETNTYQIASVDFPGEGNLSVTLSALSARVPKIRQIQQDLRKSPEDIVDSVYVPDEKIPSLSPKERIARKSCLLKK